MSRLGYITQELHAAAQEDREPRFGDSDLSWAVQWGRWDLIEQAGYDLAEVRQRFEVDAPASEGDPYNTAGVPGGGANDRAMQLNPKTGQPETVMPDLVVDDDDEADDVPYQEWNVNELRAELKERQLPADGNKPDLITRLEADDETRAAQVEEDGR